MIWRHLTAAVGLAALVFIGCGDDKAADPPPEVRDSDTTVDPPEVDLGTPADETDATENTDPATPAADASSGGSAVLRGKFVYDGKAPEPAKLAITKDQEVCGPASPVDESLVVGPDGGIANILVWVRSKDVVSEAPAGKAVLDNIGCRFEPHVLVVHTGQQLEITNSDPIGHNANVTTVINPAVNSSVPPAGNYTMSFSKEERMPAKVSCGIHPWMTAWVLVSDDTYNAVTNDDGTFEISGLPLGQELEFQVWQEKAGFLSDVTVEGGEAWLRGRFTKTFDGDVDLGVVKVSPSAFE